VAARYATTTFTIQLASGSSHQVIIGALRDSTHPAVTSAAALFSAVPPVIHPRLAAYLAVYPAAEVS
jgi:hypothetical protein